MKKVLTSALFLFFSLFSFAQDTIIKYSGETIIGKINEISPTQIKYKKADFQDGPTYVENKSDIKMIKYSNGLKEEFTKEQPKNTTVTTTGNDDYYGGGTTNTTAKTSTAPSNKIDIWGVNRFRTQGKMMNEKQMQSILLNSKDNTVLNLVGQAKDAKKLQYVGFAAIPLGIGAFGFLLAAAINSTTYSLDRSYVAGSAVCAVAAIACPIFAVTQKVKRNRCNREAIKFYNEKF
jgi:hypothetical protein